MTKSMPTGISMNDIAGDGRIRCGWAASTASELYRDYHDREWVSR